MSTINPLHQVPDANPPSKRRLRLIHPLVRTFCPEADANQKEQSRECVVSVLLLLLPLAILLFGLATGTLFDLASTGTDITNGYQALTRSLAAATTSLPFLIGAAVALLLVITWIVLRTRSRQRTATAH